MVDVMLGSNYIFTIFIRLEQINQPIMLTEMKAKDDSRLKLYISYIYMIF